MKSLMNKMRVSVKRMLVNFEQSISIGASYRIHKAVLVPVRAKRISRQRKCRPQSYL